MKKTNYNQFQNHYHPENPQNESNTFENQDLASKLIEMEKDFEIDLKRASQLKRETILGMVSNTTIFGHNQFSIKMKIILVKVYFTKLASIHKKNSKGLNFAI